MRSPPPTSPEGRPTVLVRPSALLPLAPPAGGKQFERFARRWVVPPVSILNTTGTYFTCGIGGGAGGGAAPFCAFPLYGNSLQVVVPLGKILLMFSSQPVAPGTAIDDFYAPAVRSFSSGVLIDLAIENQPALGFDINAGWSWGGYNWAQQVPAGTGLVPLLIEPPQPDNK